MKKKQPQQLTEEALELIATTFRVLSEPMRLKILHTLDKDEMSVGELVEATGGSQANISKHLNILFEAGMVSRRKEGLNTFYRISDEMVFDLCEAVCSSLGKRLITQQQAIKNFTGR